MGQVIVLKHVRLAKAFQAIESAACSLDGELHSLRALSAAGLPDFPEEAAMLRAYVRTLTVLLQAMTPDEVEDAGLSERHAKAEATVARCAANLRAFTPTIHPTALGSTA